MNRRVKPAGVLPKGAGAVCCTGCGVMARADGKGSPIVLKHKKGCCYSGKGENLAFLETLAIFNEELLKAAKAGKIEYTEIDSTVDILALILTHEFAERMLDGIIRDGQRAMKQISENVARLFPEEVTDEVVADDSAPRSEVDGQGL